MVGTNRLSPDDETGVVSAYDATTDLGLFSLTASTTVTAAILTPGSLSPTPGPSLMSQVVIVGTLISVVLSDVSALVEGSIVTLERPGWVRAGRGPATGEQSDDD